MALATKVAGRYRAGAAKVSVISSAFFGSISGSASANVASTGAITIPAMKRLGYPPQFAAAVEAVASSGGQIMPPLMGAGAFIMAELLRVKYSNIICFLVCSSIHNYASGLRHCFHCCGDGRDTVDSGSRSRYETRIRTLSDSSGICSQSRAITNHYSSFDSYIGVS
jgi:hypothetical protein